jgi:hypothetical protein
MKRDPQFQFPASSISWGLGHGLGHSTDISDSLLHQWNEEDTRAECPGSAQHGVVVSHRKATCDCGHLLRIPSHYHSQAFPLGPNNSYLALILFLMKQEKENLCLVSNFLVALALCLSIY